MNLEEAIDKFTDMDLIIAAETLVYFGDLKEIFAKCFNSLKNKGVFSFTVENSDQYPYLLQRSARFAHSMQYISEIADQSGFILLKSKEIKLRNHHENVLNGSILALQKTA